MPPRAHDPATGLHISGTRMRGFVDCKRKWAFEYIAGIKPPATDAQLLGQALHWIGENYLRHGMPPLLVPLWPGPPANDNVEIPEAKRQKLHDKAVQVFPAGQRYLPAPARPTLLVEEPMKARLDCGGTFSGTLDALDLEIPKEPEVDDHKSAKQFRWVKTPEQLLRDPQALGYFKLTVIRVPQAERVKGRWVYYRTTGVPLGKVVRFEMTREHIERGWKRINEVGAEMVDLHARKVEPLKIPPNADTCGKFGGCHFKSICHGKDGKPMNNNAGSAIFAELKAAASKTPAPTPVGLSEEDLFAGADDVPVNPPKMAAAPKAAAPVASNTDTPKAPTPAAEAFAAAITKKPRAKKDSTEAAPTGDTLAVFVDCVPLKGRHAGRPVLRLIEIAAPAMKRAAELQGVANWRLIEWGKADGVLAACFADQLEVLKTAGTPLHGVVVVDGYQPEAKALLAVLEEYADELYRKLG